MSSTTLCLACAASLPPLKKNASSPKGVFTTPCCQRPICPTCIEANPRLTKYDPCLACLGGVGVVRSASGSTPRSAPSVARDAEAFVLGDDEDEDDLDEGPALGDAVPPTQGSIPSPETLLEDKMNTTTPPEAEADTRAEKNTDSLPVKYYIARSDTLQGIILRFGLDGHQLCRLNNLPPSTLTTTPHLLHTRRFLLLPPSTRKAAVPIPIDKETPEQAREREASREKERAEKRLQTLTKEVDWRVAKAYVALADDPEEEAEERDEWERKRKEGGGVGVGVGPSNLEERAIRRYLDDEEWEESQRREGGRPTISSSVGPSEKGRRWRWPNLVTT
ncbi:hypothetical protein LshimejAT787_0803650 [Lyophyllum shimeji]|uniref:LysM domain-containing protein n=1 Tax=Lyophyllum shimeji TaxID=47721 RepID=A0A9P3UMJ2_LYOSH|nr:hypothetical protein LshimejAT787_0803650 [Lyophyllum shimeji]